MTKVLESKELCFAKMFYHKLRKNSTFNFTYVFVFPGGNPLTEVAKNVSQHSGNVMTGANISSANAPSNSSLDQGTAAAGLGLILRQLGVGGNVVFYSHFQTSVFKQQTSTKKNVFRE